jgi:hypothetical protein
MTQHMIYPSCGGKGQSLCHIDGVRDGKRFGETRLVPCSTCDGSKEITLEHHERIVIGERRREDRKSRLVTLREEAKRLGISPVELSDIEWGRTVAK